MYELTNRELVILKQGFTKLNELRHPEGQQAGERQNYKRQMKQQSKNRARQRFMENRGLN